MEPMKLYTAAESGNSWKVRILLEQLDIPYEKITVDLLNWKHKDKEFIRDVNPRGPVPVIEHEGKRFWDSAACLVYIARKTGRTDWLPLEAADMAEVMQWVAMAATEIQFGLQYGRRGVVRNRWVIGDAGNKAQYQVLGKMALYALEARLRDHDWVALDRITIADVACFPYVLNAPDADLPLEPYPGIRAWLARCQARPNWAVPPRPPTRDHPDMPIEDAG